MLLSSEERLNLDLVDDDGNTAKDYCPYNSPTYKLLIRYEARQIYHAQSLKPKLTNKKTDHYCLNRRHFESPTKTRKKALEQSRMRPHLSQSIRKAREANQSSLSSALDHEVRHERERVFSAESNMKVA